MRVAGITISSCRRNLEVKRSGTWLDRREWAVCSHTSQAANADAPTVMVIAVECLWDLLTWIAANVRYEAAAELIPKPGSPTHERWAQTSCPR